jgi:hypothetical protein
MNPARSTTSDNEIHIYLLAQKVGPWHKILWSFVILYPLYGSHFDFTGKSYLAGYAVIGRNECVTL